jgi:hypothetical protein
MEVEDKLLGLLPKGVVVDGRWREGDGVFPFVCGPLDCLLIKVNGFHESLHQRM